MGTVGAHPQLYLKGVTDEQNALFRQTCVAMGVPVSWFQSQVNARWHVNWRKRSPTFDLPNTDGAALRPRPQDAALLRRRRLPGLRETRRRRLAAAGDHGSERQGGARSSPPCAAPRPAPRATPRSGPFR